LDTKSRKSHKIAKIIIVLCVILPVVFLVTLYPDMEKAMLDKRAFYEEMWKEQREEEMNENHPEWVIERRFTNYAVEASFYLYARMLAEMNPVENDYFEVLAEYSWDSDYQMIAENTNFTATYYTQGMQEAKVLQNNIGIGNDVIGTLKLVYDENGLLSQIVYDGVAEYINEDVLREHAGNSIVQYNENSKAYAEYYGKTIEEVRFEPKNLSVEYTIFADTWFTIPYDEYYGIDSYFYISSSSLYYQTGAYWIVGLLAIFVAVVALVLPFVKPLNTGREKIFSLPFEIMIFIGVGTVFAMIGMGYVMAETTIWNLNQEFVHENLPEILGHVMSVNFIYNTLRVIEGIAWALCFFFEYMVITAIRQIIAHPIQYLKNQTLIFGFFRWIKRKFKNLYDYVTNIDINDKLEKSILKIVLINFVVVSILCCLWFGGVLGAIIYSILLYVLLKKYGAKIQKQYHSILHATEQMADGDLKISLEEDLGMFAPIGMSLEEVQQGFEKAVVEEAKSQNMKTELITNVSHDLKTPLTAIITYVDLLKKEDISDAERKAYIATLDQKSQRLKVLIEDLFEVSKAHSGNVKMNFMNIDVVSLLKQVRSEMSEQIESSNLQFRWNLPDEKMNLSLDGQRTYRVFENLLNNILKYAMPYSRVYIDLIPDDTKVQIRFRNVSAMELDFDAQRLTDRFVRGDSARNSEGSGLGLAIAKSFVELQNGTFKIEVDGDLFKVLITFER